QKEHVPGSRTYEAFLAAVTELARTQGTKASYARPGLRYPLGEAAFTILAPLGESVKEQNNNSVVLRLDYGKTSALFTGDAEKTVESALVEEYGDGLRADLLKAGHHGSNTSSNALFLYRVQPKLVAVSAGAMNDYGHPKPEMLARCLDAGAAVYRTDLDGTIVFAGDGTAFWVVT
ncbi:MAG: hypothetical protein FWH26_09975, partial [Oscillospiraceae bacterium]|nr:hypothetical protein [Oscillospiraceae bacterium]